MACTGVRGLSQPGLLLEAMRVHVFSHTAPCSLKSLWPLMPLPTPGLSAYARHAEMLLLGPRLKKANEARLQNKKQASQKKSERRSKVDY